MTEFTPTETWYAAPEFPDLDEPLQRAVTAISRKDPRLLIESLSRQVQKSPEGVVYAVLKGEEPEQYSTTEALVLFNTFANTASPNMLVRAEFIREVAKQYHIRDTEGKLKPVIMLASPGVGGSNVQLSEEDEQKVRQGELGPVARDMLMTVSRRGIGQVALLGFSLGSDITLAGSRSAYAANLDSVAVAVGDPVGVKNRNPFQLGADFFKTRAKDIRQTMADAGLSIMEQAQHPFVIGMSRLSLAAMQPLNRTLFAGLTKNVFEQRVQEILDEGLVEKLVIGYGGESAIGQPDFIEPAMQRLYGKSDRDGFVSVKVAGGNHSWGDHLVLLSKLFMRALT